MTDKIDQHVLPVVYLKAFTDSSPPRNHPPGVPFEARLWLIPPRLDGQPKPKSPRTIFRANRFYNLRSDNDLSRPYMEEALGRIETAYAAVLPIFEEGTTLDVEQYATLLVFLGSLRARHPDHLAHWQRQIDELERIHRSVERAHTGTESVADQLFRMKDEAAKLMIPDQTEAYGTVIGRHGWLLRNGSPMPFLTSDRPVIHMFLHTDEIVNLGFPKEQTPSDATSVNRAFVSYCALTPRLAFVASPLLRPPHDSMYGSTADFRLVFMLNNLVRQHASKFLISHVEDPFGEASDLIREIDKFGDELLATQSNLAVAFYTDSERYYIPCSIVAAEAGHGPFDQRITFTPTTLEGTEGLTIGDVVREIQSFEEDGSSMFIRGARIAATSDQLGGEWVIEGDQSAALHKGARSGR